MSNLTFNLSKVLILCFPNWSTNIIDAMYFMGNSPIQAVHFCKDLGVNVSSDLSWSQHHNNIISRAYRQLSLVHCTFSMTASVKKKLLCLSLVKSQLTYCLQLWRQLFIKNIAALETIQRRATKYILTDYSSNYKARLATLGMLPLIVLLWISWHMLLGTVHVSCLKKSNSHFPGLHCVTFSS